MFRWGGPWYLVDRAGFLLGKGISLALLWLVLPFVGWAALDPYLTSFVRVAAMLYGVMLLSPYLVGLTIDERVEVRWHWDVLSIPAVAYAVLVAVIVAVEAVFVDLVHQRPASEALLLLDHMAVLAVLKRLVLSRASIPFFVLLVVSSVPGLYLGWRTPIHRLDVRGAR